MILLLQIPEYRVYLQMKCTRINTTLSVIYIHPPGQIIRQATFFFKDPSQAISALMFRQIA